MPILYFVQPDISKTRNATLSILKKPHTIFFHPLLITGVPKNAFDEIYREIPTEHRFVREELLKAGYDHIIDTGRQEYEHPDYEDTEEDHKCPNGLDSFCPVCDHD